MSCSTIERVKHMDEEQPVSSPMQIERLMLMYFERQGETMLKRSKLCIHEGRVVGQCWRILLLWSLFDRSVTTCSFAGKNSLRNEGRTRTDARSVQSYAAVRSWRRWLWRWTFVIILMWLLLQSTMGNSLVLSSSSDYIRIEWTTRRRRTDY